MIKASYFPVDLGDFHMSRSSTDQYVCIRLSRSRQLKKSLGHHKLPNSSQDLLRDRIFFLYRGRRILEAI